MYKNRQAGFSSTGAIIGAVVGVALIVATGGTALLVGAVAGGAVGGFLGDSGSEDAGVGSTSGTTGSTGTTGSSTSNTATTTDCSTVQTTYNDLSAKYAAAQASLAQAQANLSEASTYGTTTSNNYDSINNACYAGTSTSTCGTTNDGSCTDLQNQCNNMQALVDSTNQATCQLQTTALSLLSGSTASSTASPYANVFTLGLNPSTVAVGDTVAVVSTISISTVATNALKSFSIAVYDAADNFIGYLTNKVAVQTASTQLTVQYNFQLSNTIGPGTYTVKIFNDYNTSEMEKAPLTIVSSSTAQTTASSNNPLVSTSTSASFDMALSPATIGQGGSFTVNASIKSASVTSYNIDAYQSSLKLGALASNVGITSNLRPTPIQQTFKTSSTIPPGSYSVVISNSANPNEKLATTLVVTAGAASSTVSGFSQTGTGTTGTTGTTGATSQTSVLPAATAAKICSLTVNLKVGSRDSSTNGMVSALQSYLKAKGYYSYPTITGYFGNVTKAAVQSFQASNNVSPASGLVGPLTRAAMARISPCNGR